MADRDLEIDPTMKADRDSMSKSETKEFRRARADIASGVSAGEFEQWFAANTSRSVPQLQLSPRFWTHAAPPDEARQYETKYNLYTVPLRNMVVAVGRVKDLILVGAPNTPSEISPGIAAKFRNIGRKKVSDADEQSAFTDWRAQNAQLEAGIGQQMAGRADLTAALDRISAVHIAMDRKAYEAKLAGKMAQAAAMEQTAGTLVKIGTFAWKIYRDLDLLDEIETGGYDPQNPDDPLTSKMGSGRIDGVRTRLEGYGKSGMAAFDLQEIATVLMYGAEYEELKREIQKLEREISQLELDEDWFNVQSAWDQLSAVKLKIGLGKSNVAGQRQLARERASDYAQSFSGKDEARLVTMMAQAYNELSMVGAMTMGQKAGVEAVWGRTAGWLSEKYLPLQAMNSPLPEDSSQLRSNLRRFRAQHLFLEENLPQWETTANQWKRFLQRQTGGRSLDS